MRHYLLALGLLVLLPLVQPAHAQSAPAAPSGCAVSASGVIVCTAEPGSGTANSNPVTQNPNNCGYVNGVYACYDGGGNVMQSGGTASNPGTPTPVQQSNTPDAGTQQNCGFGAIGCHLSQFATWLSNKLLYVPRKCLEWFLDALGNMIVAIPVPQFVTDAKTALGTIPSSVGWFLGLMQFKFGLVTMASAYTLKFLARIVPFFV